MKITQFIKDNKKGLIIGFTFGAFIAPFLATLGLIISFFEVLRPVLIGPMDLIGNLIPNIQTGPASFYVPWYKWMIVLGFNGVCYGVLGGIVQAVFDKRDL